MELLKDRLHPDRLACLDRAVDAFLKHHRYGLTGASVLVTGARGYFGRYVVEALVRMNEHLRAHEKPIEIIAIDSGLVGQELNWNDWLNLPHLEMRKHDMLHDLEFYGTHPTHIIHLAGIASPYWYEKLPRETVDVATLGARHMTQLAERYRARMLFTSSSEVYQTAAQVPTPETYVGAIPSTTERSCYDVSKLLAETECYIAATRHDVNVSVVRIFNSFGPGMAQHDRRILTRMADAMVKGQALPVFQKSGLVQAPRRTYTPVSNTLLGTLLVLVSGQTMKKNTTEGIYNVGLDSPEVSVHELVAMARELGFNIATQVMDAPSHYASEPERRCPDVRQLRALGWEPCMDLKEGLERFLRWAKETYQKGAP